MSINTKHKILVCLLLTLTNFSLSNADDKICENNICFNKKLNGQNLLGVSTFKYLFFDLYVGAYYQESFDEQPFNPNKKATLILEYFREIRKEDFIESTRNLIQNNKEISYDLIKDKFLKVYEAYNDVKIGDRYTLEYTPLNNETCLYYNEAKKVCEYGIEFYKSFFGIWISDYSVNRDFTKKLLNKKI